MKVTHPAISIYAVHPAYFGQMDQMAQNPHEQAKDFEEYSRRYLGQAFSSSLMAFKPDEVYQLSEREYYSYSDGIRYYLSNAGKRIALIPLQGLLYGYKYDYLSEKIEAAKHEAYHGILLIADTPGGQVRKMDTLREAIADYPKPIGVYVSGMLASAGAYVTASADFILANPKDDNALGSVGIFQLMENIADKNEKEGVDVKIFRNEGADQKYKPNAYEPWDEEDLEAIQAKVNEMGERFYAVMKDNRPFSQSNWEEIKKGASYDHTQALSLGLIDGLGTREEALEKVASINHQLYI